MRTMICVDVMAYLLPAGNATQSRSSIGTAREVPAPERDSSTNPVNCPYDRRQPAGSLAGRPVTIRFSAVVVGRDSSGAAHGPLRGGAAHRGRNRDFVGNNLQAASSATRSHSPT